MSKSLYFARSGWSDTSHAMTSFTLDPAVSTIPDPLIVGSRPPCQPRAQVPEHVQWMDPYPDPPPPRPDRALLCCYSGIFWGFFGAAGGGGAGPIEPQRRHAGGVARPGQQDRTVKEKKEQKSRRRGENTDQAIHGVSRRERERERGGRGMCVCVGGSNP